MRIRNIASIALMIIIMAIFWPDYKQDQSADIYHAPFEPTYAEEILEAGKYSRERIWYVSDLLTMKERIFELHHLYPRDYRPLIKTPVKVKGIYMTGAVFHHTKLFNRLIDIVDNTELNSLVIDIKDDRGYLSAKFDSEEIRKVDPNVHRGRNVYQNMRIITEKNIYPIARVVVFKDPLLASAHEEYAILDKNGRPWLDRKGLAWVDPHCKEVWAYTVNIAKEAAKLGFHEIQFDYVRFPTDGNIEMAVYPYATGQKKEDVISEFLAYAKEELDEYNVFISADVFGLTTLTVDDMAMGQKFEKIMTQVDYICPMVYPSHYEAGNYGFSNPNANPHEVVRRALLDALNKAQGSEVIVRPWLQDFTLGKPKYGIDEVLAQIEATYAAGLDEWLLWNAGNNYTVGALMEN